MFKPIEILNDIKAHHQLFGAGGVSFLFKKKYRPHAVIDINIKGYSHPIYLRNNTSDIPMFYYIFQAKEYNVSFDFEPKVIVDCGAHIGLGAIYFAHKYPKATIYCIEPEESNFEILLRNVEHYPNIKCLHCGVWNKSTHLKIIDKGLGNWGFMTEEVSDPGGQTTEAISIPDLMSRFGIEQIDICKINIEGTEKELFLSNYESWMSKTKAIIIELHDRMRTGCSNSFFSALTKYKFSVTPHGSYLICTIDDVHD